MSFQHCPAPTMSWEKPWALMRLPNVREPGIAILDEPRRVCRVKIWLANAHTSLDKG